MPDEMQSMRLQDMTTGEVQQRARQAGVQDVESKNKSELIEAMGGNADAGQGGGQHTQDPAPKNADPQQYKNVPGNQT